MNALDRKGHRQLLLSIRSLVADPETVIAIVCCTLMVGFTWLYYWVCIRD